jgi:signal transduction histidine kinase
VSEHHGTIDVESAPGQGARFILTFPALAPRLR